MSAPFHQIDADRILVNVKKRTNARAILTSRSSQRLHLFAFVIAIAIPNFFLNDFSAPLAVKILIAVSFVSAIVAQVDAWDLRRRLEAAIVLLEQIDEKRE